MKNIVVIAITVLSTSFGNLLLGLGMKQMPDFAQSAISAYIPKILSNPGVLFGTALTLIYMVAQLMLLSWADLTYVLPITASSYAFSAILAKFVLHESISVARWVGIGLISLGVAVVSETKVKTADEVEPEETMK